MAVKRQSKREKREEKERRAAQERAAQAQRSQAEWEDKGLRPASEQKKRVAPLVVRLDKQDDESAAAVASRIPDETERGNFITKYRKASGSITPKAMLMDEAEALIPKARENTTASAGTSSASLRSAPSPEGKAFGDENQSFWEGVKAFAGGMKESAGAFWEGLTAGDSSAAAGTSSASLRSAPSPEGKAFGDERAEENAEPKALPFGEGGPKGRVRSPSDEVSPAGDESAPTSTHAQTRWIDLARAENADDAPEDAPEAVPNDVREDAQEAAPEAEEERIDLTGDPVAAISYGRQNGYGSLTEETLLEMDDYVQKTPGRRALFGVLTDENERALVGEDGREKGNRTAIGVQYDNYGTLGGTMSKYALRLGSEDFPQELATDTIGTFVTLIDEADEWAKGQIARDEDFELFNNRYDAYLEAYPEKRKVLDDAFALENEIRSARSEEARRQEEAEKQAAQDALEAARAAVRAGEATDGQWALVAAQAPELTRNQMLEDSAYRALSQEIAVARTLSDSAGEEDWMNAATLSYMRAHDLGGDMNSVAAMQTKDIVAGYLTQALDEQMRVAASLGYESLEAYHAATGTGDMELLRLRAEAAMRADEKGLTPDVMEAIEEANAPAYEGTQEGAQGMARAIGLGVNYGITSNHAQKLEAITTLLALSDIENDGARVAAKYTKTYGAYSGRAAYERDMRALAKEGYFPSQELTDYVLGYLDEGGDPYALGILPEDLGWAAKPAAEQKQKADYIAAMAQKHLTPAQGTAFEITGSTAANVENQLMARTLGLMGANSWVTSLLAYGAEPYLEGAKGALGEGQTGRAANLLGATQAAAIATANAGTEKAFASRVGKLTGMSAAQKLGMEALGPVGGTKVYTGMARLMAAGRGVLGGTAQSLAGEVFHDELLERLYQAGFGGTAKSLLTATNGGMRLPSPSQILRAGADGLRAIDAGEEVAGVLQDAPKNALYMLPMALVSGGIEGASEWKSTKAVRQLAQTGSEKDARAALDAISEDMSDGQKARAFDAGMRAAGRAEAAAQILVTDREIEQTLEAASGAQAQADAHGEEADKSRARMQTAAETMQDAQARMDAGEIEPELPVTLTRAADEFAKARQGLDEHEREQKDKARESERLFDAARGEAAAQAARQMNGATGRLISELSEMAPEIADRAREEEQARLEARIAGLRAQMAEEFDKGDGADQARIEELSTQTGVLEAYLDDMREAENAGEGEAESEAIRQRAEERLSEIASAREAAMQPEAEALIEAQATRERLETEQTELAPVFDSLRQNTIFVDDAQVSGILYETGAKTLSEAGRMLGLRLTRDRSAGIPLDGSFYADLKALAPGHFREEWDAHPEAALVSLSRRRQLLRGDVAGSKRAEKEAQAAYRQKAAEKYQPVIEEAKRIPPGYALSQFENESLPESDVSTQETNVVLAGTSHRVDTDEALRKGAAERIARTGLRGVTEELMRATRLTNEDIVAGRECLRLLRDNGDLIRHATLAAKLGAEGTRTGKELRAYAQFQRESAESAGADTLKMAEAYNRRKGRYRRAEQETQAQLSLGETPYQPFMEAQVSRSTSDPAMQQLASDIGKRSGLALYWADMPDGVRAFFDRDKGVIVMNQKVGAAQGAYVAAIHEYTHYMEGQPGYDAYAEAILKAAYGGDEDAMKLDAGVIRDEYAQSGRTLTDELLRRELVAAATEQVILGDEAFMRTLFTGGKGGAAVRMLAGMDAFLRKRGARKQGAQEVTRYNLIEAARARMREAVSRSGEWKKGEEKGEGAQFALVGRTEDGKGIYQSNFDPDTPRQVKIDRLVDLWQNVWSKKPIEMEVVGQDGKTKRITAQFNPDYDAENNRMTDLGKVLHSRNGSAGDRTITLNLADDLYDMAGETKQVGSEAETGKAGRTHEGVKEWYYFSNDFVYRDSSGDKAMTLWLDLKEREDGGWVYQLYAKKTKEKDVSSPPPEIGRARQEQTSSDISIAQSETGVKTKDTQSGAQYAIETRQRSLFDKDLRPHADVNDVYGKVMANIEFLERSEDVNRDNEWNAPLNAFQREMIDRYKLRGTPLPGLLYNRATTRQRMLCAVFATPQDSRGIGNMTLTEQLDALARGKLAVVTEADYNYILSQAAIVEGSETDEDGLPLSREGQQAYGRMRDAQANIEPASLGDKLSAWRYMNLLSSPVTTIKNLAGNALMQEADRISKNRLTEFVDKLVERRTGTRTMARATREERRAGTQAAIRRGRDAFDDAFVAGTSTSRSRNYDVGGNGRVFQNEALELGRNMINFCMDAGDQVFMEKAIAEEEAALERLKAKIRDEETGEMREMTRGERYREAYARASQRFYHDDNNVILNTIRGFYNTPRVETLARMVIPFVKTPSNVALRMFDYSPLGLAKSIFLDGIYAMNANKGDDGVGVNFDQAKFVMGVGRGMTGTGVTVAGMLLYSAGLLSFGREDEENDRRRGVLGALGEPYSLYVNIGGTKHELAFTLPVTAGLSIGAGIAAKIQDGEEAMDIAICILSEQFNQIFDNTYLSSFNDIFRGYDDGAGIGTRFFGTVAKSYAQQMFSPSILRAIAKAMDPYQRDTQSGSSLRQFISETIVQNWPGLRQTLSIKTDLTGEAMTQHRAYGPGGAWESAALAFVDSMLSPTATYSDKDDAALCELLDLSYRTGETSFLPTYLASKNELKVTKTLADKLGDELGAYTLMLTDEERREANRMYGDILFNGTRGVAYPGPGMERYDQVEGLRSLMESAQWLQMDDGERIKAVSDMAKGVKELVIVQTVRRVNE